MVVVPSLTSSAERKRDQKREEETNLRASHSGDHLQVTDLCVCALLDAVSHSVH